MTRELIILRVVILGGGGVVGHGLPVLLRHLKVVLLILLPLHQLGQAFAHRGGLPGPLRGPGRGGRPLGGRVQVGSLGAQGEAHCMSTIFHLLHGYGHHVQTSEAVESRSWVSRGRRPGGQVGPRHDPAHPLLQQLHVQPVLPVRVRAHSSTLLALPHQRDHPPAMPGRNGAFLAVPLEGRHGGEVLAEGYGVLAGAAVPLAGPRPGRRVHLDRRRQHRLRVAPPLQPTVQRGVGLVGGGGLGVLLAVVALLVLRLPPRRLLLLRLRRPGQRLKKRRRRLQAGRVQPGEGLLRGLPDLVAVGGQGVDEGA
mmetsp:Transcript_53751/g.142964  ORF Transcript_53751/g.142964 Transcript_53751/m.142964 type:complete len:310 (-) Transcript_53751:305-1234(-)